MNFNVKMRHEEENKVCNDPQALRGGGGRIIIFINS